MMKSFGKAISAGLAMLVLAAVPAGSAAEVSVAVAANFTAPAERISEAFKAHTGHEAVLSFGATGALYTQIVQGAPFEILLAADMARPEKAAAEGFGVAGTVFTYAVGKLVLYSTVLDVSGGLETFRGEGFHHVAIADPASAPYGAAAIEVLKTGGLNEAVAPKIVTGENISQTLQFVETGNAELGFVALSQVTGKPATSVWLVPQDFYMPIRQGAVLLKTGEGREAATAFFEFLKSAEARDIIAEAGYGPGD